MSDLKAKMHHIRFLLGLLPRPTVGAYSAPIDSIAVFKGREERGRKGKGEGSGEEVEGGILLTQKF